MKQLSLVPMLSVLVTIVHAEDTLKIPKGVRYKKTTAKVNEEAKSLILARFSANTKDEDILSLFVATVICGPCLWRELKMDNAMSELEKGNMLFQIPVFTSDGTIVRMDTLEGKLLQSPGDILPFWKAFTQRTDFTNLKVRKLNEAELGLFWSMIPFDIEEPLFIMESKKNKVLVVFTKELKIMWIDDYQDIALK